VGERRQGLRRTKSLDFQFAEVREAAEGFGVGGGCELTPDSERLQIAQAIEDIEVCQLGAALEIELGSSANGEQAGSLLELVLAGNGTGEPVVPLDGRLEEEVMRIEPDGDFVGELGFRFVAEGEQPPRGEVGAGDGQKRRGACEADAKNGEEAQTAGCGIHATAEILTEPERGEQWEEKQEGAEEKIPPAESTGGAEEERAVEGERSDGASEEGGGNEDARGWQSHGDASEGAVDYGGVKGRLQQ
jgi:hypothetical protein